MVLEEVVEKLAMRLAAIERALKGKGVLTEADIIPGAFPFALPTELGERIRALNQPLVFNNMAAKQKEREWLIHTLWDNLQMLTEQVDELNTRLKAIETKGGGEPK